METDTQLLEASRAGDRRAFAAIVERYKALVCSVTYSSTGDFGVSEDLAQETFLTAWSNLNSIRNLSSLSAWLCGIARNISLRWQRKRQRDILADAKPLEHSATHLADGLTPRQSAIGKEQQALIWQALKNMPQDYRIPLVLYYREGKSVKLVAETINLSTDAVKQRLHRGRRMLKDEVANLVEESLASTRPGKDFTLGILAVLPKLPTGIATGGTVSYQVAGSVERLMRFATSGVAVKTGMVGVPLVLLGLAAILYSNDSSDSTAPASVALEQDEAAYESPEDVAELEPSPPPESSPVVEATLALKASPPAVSIMNAALKPREVAKPGYPGTTYPESLKDTVTGVVYDPYGRALEGAKVWIARFAMDARDTRATLSDSEGRFKFKLPSGQWMLQARKGTLGGEANSGFAGQLITEGTGKTIDTAIRMEPCCRVYGRIYDNRTKKPISFGKIWTKSRILVTADKEGHYEIEGQRQGDQTLIVLCPGYERKYVIYTPVQGEETELDLLLDRGGKVRGQVVDSQGHPLAHAWVSKPMSGVGSLSANYEVCDENGRFEFDGLPLGKEVRIEARLPRYGNLCPPLERIEGRTFARRKLLLSRSGGPLDGILFTLDPMFQEERRGVLRWVRPELSGAIAGRVVTPDGRPVRNFRILTQRPHARGDRGNMVSGMEINEYCRGYSFTSDDGSFVLAKYWRDGEPGMRVRLVALADGYGEAVADMAMIHPNDSVAVRKPVLLRLAPQRRLAVRVTEQGSYGRPVAGALVTVRDANPALEGAFKWGGAHHSSERPVSLYTDDQGWARFTGLSLGEGMVLAEKEGFARGRRFWGGPEKVLTVAVVAEEAVVEGRALHADGKPIERGTVALYWADSFPYDGDNSNHDNLLMSLTPEDQGQFRFDQLPPGAYALKVSQRSDGFSSAKYGDEFQLGAGDHFRVTYPGDSILNNPRRWLNLATGDPGDIVLRQRLIGTWYRDGFLDSGASLRTVWSFGENGDFDLWIFKPADERTYADGTYSSSDAFSAHDAGLFRVEGGSVRVAWERGGFRTYTRVKFPAPDTLVLLKTWRSPAEQPFKRTDQLDRLLREGVRMSRPLPAPAAPANDPLPRSGPSYFGKAGI